MPRLARSVVSNHDLLSGVSADDHHTQAHVISGADHTGTLGHAALSAVTADQHHTQAHVISGADHTGTLGHAALSGVTASQHHGRTEAKLGTSAAPSVATWSTAFAAVPVVTTGTPNIAAPRFPTTESVSTTGATARIYTDTGGAEVGIVSFMAQEAT